MSQLAQVFGALLILGAFMMSQAGRLDQHSYVYLLLNFAGSAVLAVLAFQGRQWGFLLLEGVWGLVSAWGVITHER